MVKKKVNQNLTSKLEALPRKPGVYIFKDAKANIIYIGKAKNLRNRVRSYFTGKDDGRYQYPRLVASISDLDIVLTRTEIEALRTEAVYIRKYHPKFNVDLKDDKSYPYLKITREQFPRITLMRKPHTSKAEYFGPYTDVKSTRYLIRTLKHILQIRDCNLTLNEEKISLNKFSLCLDFHIGKCGGPCVGKVSKVEYQKGIVQFKRFLRGKHDEIIEELEKEMRVCSDNLNFEKAADIRDRLVTAKNFSERQSKVAAPKINQDAIGVVREDSFAAFSVMKIRNGRIVGKSPFYMNRTDGLDDSDLIEAFITRHYNLVDRLPEEILTFIDPPDRINLEKYLSELSGRKVHLHIPHRGEKRSLLRLAEVNAEQLMIERRLMAEKRDFTPRSIIALQEVLHLKTAPTHIEAFDISNLQGSDSVASMVLFRDGKPYKSGYRIYKIKTVSGIDDFASIAEAVKRRYSRLKLEIMEHQNKHKDTTEEENIGIPPALPDLILIDGGKGQLKYAKNILIDLGLPDLPILGLAKRLEEIILPDMSSILLSRSSSALRLLQQVRNEAHRFAITRHRMLRSKRQIKSKLDEIPGIGPARRTALLMKFGSAKRIRSASNEELSSVKGMNKKAAENVLAFLADAKL
ncbi:excinuclease ABC subunit UvrC [bacterium]|nr:excinuclease ABC subunit UvrC [bacterium]